MKKRFRLGIKIWSTNFDYITELVKLIDELKYSYIELFAVPGSYDDTISRWRRYQLPFIVHAAHFSNGMDLSDKEKVSSNKILIEEALKFADQLSATQIIFHSGVRGNLNETAHQLSELADRRTLIENVPSVSVDGTFKLLGSTPEDINFLVKSVTNLGFCLDIVHSICTANYLRMNSLQLLKKYIELNPKLVHLADCKKNCIMDQHLIIGSGTLPINEYLNLLPNGPMITIESNRKLNNLYKLASREADLINGK